MRAVIAKKGCIGCGLCTDICPTVFKMSKEAYAEVYAEEVSQENRNEAIEAKENCPVSVIKLED
ncbi:ferredoxin [Anaerocolumna sp. MB42-C2]|uniref:ferredoxin n=1 Tax=Anaerocolumna sp. MB42-C2 TaxID=3070997 RepID=UPI0027E1BFEE|nr:ferredoxin [Anaerocolumna sp. MB42-C2]WMJ88775.1 ferredoxin [Anaerocolumna sp. MB42-C2]